MPFSVKVETGAATRMLTELQRKQIPFAASRALNQVAFELQLHERLSIKQTFKTPRPFTQRSVLVTQARKTNLSATVFIRPEVARYLAPYEFGGVHVVPGKAQLVPINLRLDQYGQLTKATLAKLNEASHEKDSGVFFGRVGKTVGYWMRLKPPAAPTTKRRGKTIYGPVKPPPRLKLLGEIEHPVEVHGHLDFEKTAREIVHDNWPDAFERAIASALASAR